MNFSYDHSVQAPKEPHMALLAKDLTAIAIPRGATLYIIEDPSRADKILPLVLKRAAMKRLDFYCACGREGCKDEYRYVLEKVQYTKRKGFRK